MKMTSKTVVFCAQALLLIQYISCQCIAGYSMPNAAASIAYSSPSWNSYAAPLSASGTPSISPSSCTAEWAEYSPASLTASHGGGLAIASASPLAPTGVAMTSENAYEGALAVAGASPYLGAVALEGLLPTAGSGSIMYGCGGGNVAVLSDSISAGYNGLVSSYGYSPELGYGYASPGIYEKSPARHVCYGL